MKITKTKKVETEEIDVQPGIYYFQDIDQIYNKYIIMEEDEGLTDYIAEQVRDFNNSFSISKREGYTCREEDIPYYLKQFLLGISGKKIEKEEFDKIKQRVLERL